MPNGFRKKTSYKLKFKNERTSYRSGHTVYSISLSTAKRAQPYHKSTKPGFNTGYITNSYDHQNWKQKAASVHLRWERPLVTKAKPSENFAIKLCNRRSCCTENIGAFYARDGRTKSRINVLSLRKAWQEKSGALRLAGAHSFPLWFFYFDIK